MQSATSGGAVECGRDKNLLRIAVEEFIGERERRASYTIERSYKIENALTGLGAGIGMGIATGKAVEATARQPEAVGKIRTMLLLGLAFAETTAIYGLLVSILLIFVS